MNKWKQLCCGWLSQLLWYNYKWAVTGDSCLLYVLYVGVFKYFRQRGQKLDCPWNWSTRPLGKTLTPTMSSWGQLCLYGLLLWLSGVFGAIDVLPGTPDCIYVFVQSPLLFHYFAKFQSSHKMKKIIIIIHGFYTALFSALKQTRMWYWISDCILL